MSPLLDEIRVIEVGGRGAAICGRLFAELGAEVLSVHQPGARVGAGAEPGEAIVLQSGKRHREIDLASESGRASFDQAAAAADLIVIDLSAHEIDALALHPDLLRNANPRLVVATITPFGLTGPRRNYRGGDLVAFHASGIAHQLFGRVEDPEAEPPSRAAGRQSGFIVGLTAACAAMNALYQQQHTGLGESIDVSAQEAMSLMTAGELAQPAFGGKARSRQGSVRGGSAIGPRLPTLDGYVAISPRETGQWAQWLHLLGDPEWGSEPRFATLPDRTKNYDALFDLMAEWSSTRTKDEITQLCQEKHIPAFPFGTAGDRLKDPQSEYRESFVPLARPGAEPVMVSRPPFGLPKSDYAPPTPPVVGEVAWRPRPEGSAARTQPAGVRRLPLEGVRVLDFSWVIAGPTGTRYLSLMGAEVIKVENPGRPDNARAGTLHDVVGQSKLGLSIDLKAEGALDAVRRLLKDTDIVVDNFATGVMDRLGLGYDDLRAIRPDIIQLSSSGLGRHGPQSDWVAYGSLLDAYVGFLDEATPGRPPKSGMAWIDPLAGLFLGFAVVAALRERDRHGTGRHIDFSMVEAVLWTMPEAVIAAQLPNVKLHTAGNDSPNHVPHNIFRCAGDDRWLALAVTDDTEWRALCSLVPTLSDIVSLTQPQRREQAAAINTRLAAWLRDRDSIQTMDLLQVAGVPASATYSSDDLFEDQHLRDRGFYKLVRNDDGAEHWLPGLPWRWGDDSLIQPRPAPGQGQHNKFVLTSLAGLSEAETAALELAGAFGKPSSPPATPAPVTDTVRPRA